VVSSQTIDLAGASVFNFRTTSAGLCAEIQLKEKGMRSLEARAMGLDARTML
jgi:hypothetical protein